MTHWLTPRQEAQLRLSAWGEVTRKLAKGHGPAANPYSQQPFLNARVDNDVFCERMDNNDRLEEAMQVDGWMDDIKAKSKTMYTAGVIIYVVYPWKHQFEERLRDWQKETGLKQARLYQCIRAVERVIAMNITAS